MSKRIIAVALIVSLFALPAAAHELTIKNTAGNTPKAGEPFALTVQSAHKFIVPEEVEILSRVKAGIIEDGKFIESELKGNDPELCIDFSVTPKDLSGSFIVVATKDGESWCVTNEGGKSGARKDLEAQGLKVLSANKYDKYAKAIFNTSKEDKNFAQVLGHPLELIPITNPADAKVGEYFDVKILLNGQPYTGPVWATYDGFVTEYENTYAYYTEAENGEAHVKITAPGWWGIRAAQSGLPGVEGDYDHLNLRAFVLFEVK
ncbi:MAG: DUF4198 domain-containing protein [Synergistaceae bacterium]|nr:DUF4198 domain-containing protein [Synergistaceae bacterium]